MRDGIALARAGLPAVALVTEDFWPQGDFVARSFGMPEIPRLRLPHPVAGSGKVAMRRVAGEIAPQLIELLAGTPAGSPAEECAGKPVGSENSAE